MSNKQFSRVAERWISPVSPKEGDKTSHFRQKRNAQHAQLN